jgi:L-galactose dehydrogenase
MTEMEYRTLDGTDLKVSVIGFGASPLGNEFGAIDADEGERAVRHAIDSGGISLTTYRGVPW